MNFQERVNFWLNHGLSPDEAEVQAGKELEFDIEPVPWQDTVDGYKEKRSK